MITTGADLRLSFCGKIHLNQGAQMLSQAKILTLGASFRQKVRHLVSPETLDFEIAILGTNGITIPSAMIPSVPKDVAVQDPF